jgi:NTE family protein
VTHSDHDVAVILPGGGARAAYQVGALRAVAKILGRAERQPFRIICGTSAGAINAATLAVHADSFRRGVGRLLRWWQRVKVEDVYRADLGSVSLHGMRWLASVLVGAGGPKRAAAMLDNSPLGGVLRGDLALERVAQHVDSRRLHALAINATSYTTGQAVTFFQGSPTIAPWQRTRRRGERAVIDIDHLLASTAIPFVFPAAKIGEDFFADGSMRQIAPLSPALHLGAGRILAVSTNYVKSLSEAEQPQTAGYPPPAQILGQLMDAIFIDAIDEDAGRLERSNMFLRALAPEQRRDYRVVDLVVIRPSQDLGVLAGAYEPRLPRGFRFLTRGLGTRETSSPDFLSLLMFQPDYLRKLIEIGEGDAEMRLGEIGRIVSVPVAQPASPPDRRAE